MVMINFTIFGALFFDMCTGARKVIHSSVYFFIYLFIRSFIYFLIQEVVLYYIIK